MDHRVLSGPRRAHVVRRHSHVGPAHDRTAPEDEGPHLAGWTPATCRAVRKRIWKMEFYDEEDVRFVGSRRAFYIRSMSKLWSPWSPGELKRLTAEYRARLASRSNSEVICGSDYGLAKI